MKSKLKLNCERCDNGNRLLCDKGACLMFVNGHQHFCPDCGRINIIYGNGTKSQLTDIWKKANGK